ncbi:hypothetical protein [Marinilactibacillus psychrotolerans]|uniref:hypothetical protein n=1 Tax=Marinilactibacillus psychrotolerans TaxID=191770 RepID=UPI00388BB8D6
MDNKQREIINILEMDELEYLKSLIDQIQDNLDDINTTAEQSRNQQYDITAEMVVREVERLSNRHTDMLNLAKDLLVSADTKREQVLNKIFGRGAYKNEK